jgi:hypothetical protein
LRDGAVAHPQRVEEALPQLEHVERGERGRDLARGEEGVEGGECRGADFAV